MMNDRNSSFKGSVQRSVDLHLNIIGTPRIGQRLDFNKIKGSRGPRGECGGQGVKHFNHSPAFILWRETWFFVMSHMAVIVYLTSSKSKISSPFLSRNEKTASQFSKSSPFGAARFLIDSQRR